MGVKGLWQLVSSSGAPIPVESLEHKIIAIDISIWLHQAVRGFKGYGVNSVANGHLLTLFHRVCKLLYYRIRPVFVFDGGVPHLKRQTLSARRLKREVAAGKAQKIKQRLLANLLKSQAVRKALGKKGPGPALHHVAKPVKQEKDLFELAPLPLDNQLITSSKHDSDDEEDYILKNLKASNLHNIELETDDFKSLPIETKHEILSELQDTRKENSWSSVNEMPEESKEFSSFQMGRLLKRRKFQETLDNVRAEIRKNHTAQMEAQLFGELEQHVSLTHRIISEDETHSILLKKFNTDSNIGTDSQIHDQITESPKKVLNKVRGAGQDFLTVLAKQGIVSVDSKNHTLVSDSSESDDDLSSDDDAGAHTSMKKRRKLDELTFLKAMEYMLDESEFTQEELMKLIQQSKLEVDDEISHANSNNLSVEDQPSTSFNAPGSICNDSLGQESSDDDDLVDVPIPEYDEVSETGVSSQVDTNMTHENINITGKKTDTSPQKGSNLDVILGTKTSSLYLKIVQKHLDDVVQTSTNRKVNTVDTRKQGHSMTQELIKAQTSYASTSSNYSELHSTVPVSVDLSKPFSTDDDIFADIFSKNREHTLLSNSVQRILDKSNSSGSLSLKHSNMNAVHLDTDFLESVKKNDDMSFCNVADEASYSEHSKEKLGNESIFIRPKRTDLKKSIIQTRSSMFTCNKDDEKAVKELTNNENINRENMATENPKSQHSESKNIDIDATMNAENMKISEGLKSSELLSVPSISKQTGSSLERNSIKTTVDAVDSTSETLPISRNSTDCATFDRPVIYTDDDLNIIEGHLATEQNDLIAEARKLETVAAELDDSIYSDAQEMLRLFGIPYLVAPMEAEAQCAFLDKIGLTHGTITNDSDIFLFGGKNVYKNFFNNAKYVELFKYDTINQNLGLDQEKMITLALLTGSDYTVGIESVGAVLAMEILAEFPGENIESLKNFRKWWNVAHRHVSANQESKIKQRLRLLHLPDSFPNEHIFKAYLSPEIDESREKFSWAVPSLEKLEQYTADKFGWNMSKTDEILIPVFKKLGVKESQMRIDSYFTSIKLIKDDQIHSKRLLHAIAKSKGEHIDPQSENPKVKKSNINNNNKQLRPKVLLTDPSEGTYGAGSLPTTSGEAEKKSRRKRKLDRLTEEECSSKEVVSKPLTKEEKKNMIYKKLVQKDEIIQREMDMKEMKRKKLLAAEIMKQTKSGQKSKIAEKF